MEKIRLNKVSLIKDIDNDCIGCPLCNCCNDEKCQAYNLRAEVNLSNHIFDDTNNEPRLMRNVIEDRICGCCAASEDEDCIDSDCYILKIKNNLMNGTYSI